MKNYVLLIAGLLLFVGCGTKSKSLEVGSIDLPRYTPNPRPEDSPSPSPTVPTCHASWAKDTFTYTIQNPGGYRVPPFEIATLKIEASAPMSSIIPSDVLSFPLGVSFQITGASFSADKKTLSLTGYFDDPTPSSSISVQAKMTDNGSTQRFCVTDNNIRVTRNVMNTPPSSLQCTLSASPSTVTVVLGAAGTQIFNTPSSTFNITITGGTATLDPFGAQQNPNFQADASPATPLAQISVKGTFIPPYFPGDYPFTAKVRNGSEVAYCSTTVKLVIEHQPWVLYYRHYLMGAADAAGNQDVIDWDYTSSGDSPSGFQISTETRAFQIRMTPSGVWNSGLYRCRALNIPVVRHFLSAESGCEAPNGIPDPIIDYKGTYTHLLGYMASSASGSGAFLLKRATRDLNFGSLNHVLTFLSISDSEFYSGTASTHYTLGGPLGWVIP